MAFVFKEERKFGLFKANNPEHLGPGCYNVHKEKKVVKENFAPFKTAVSRGDPNEKKRLNE